jgi:arabinan endo-1,5-alpha-L-arabinosidase
MLPLFILLAVRPPALAQEGAVRGVHDPCIIRAGDAFYLFSTGPGIPIRRSADLFRWERAGRVFDASPAWFAREVPGATGPWAPDIARFGGLYRLYYSVSTFGSNRSCIGLATNRALDPADPEYKWVDQGPVLRSSRRDDYNAIDPNVAFDEDGRPWLAFGSFWSGIKLTRLDPDSGKPVEPVQLISLAARPGSDAVEAPFLIRRRGFYYLFVSFDKCCQGVQSTYRVVVGRSPELTGPYVDRLGKPMVEGGGTTVVESAGRVRGPGHCAVLSEGGRDWLVHHFYDADNRGAQTLQIRPLRWGEDGFPVAGEPIDGPITPTAAPAPGR